MEKGKIALVEIGNSHDECLLTQIHALKADFHITLVLNEELFERSKALLEVCDDGFSLKTKNLSSAQVARELWSYLKANNFEKVIFNTAQGNVIRRVAIKAMGNKMEFIGIIHTVRKFQGSFTQKLINWKIKKYLFLSEHLYKKVQAPSGIKMDYFYPIDFPQFEKQTEQPTKPRIGIIGGVENRRKDIDGFLQMTANLTDEVEFYFIGKTDPENELYPTLKERNNVIVFDTFVEQEQFDAFVKSCDVILPLVHPNTPSADQYFVNQISGATTVAYGYQKPLLIHEAYAHVEDMQGVAVYYQLDNFEQQLKDVLTQQEHLSKAIKNKFQSKKEQQRYLDFIIR